MNVCCKTHAIQLHHPPVSLLPMWFWPVTALSGELVKAVCLEEWIPGAPVGGVLGCGEIGEGCGEEWISYELMWCCVAGVWRGWRHDVVGMVEGWTSTRSEIITGDRGLNGGRVKGCREGRCFSG